MVQNLSVIFILVTAAIAPVVALPVPVNPVVKAAHPDHSNSLRTNDPSIPTRPHSNEVVVGSSNHPTSAPPSHTTSSSKPQTPIAHPVESSSHPSSGALATPSHTTSSSKVQTPSNPVVGSSNHPSSAPPGHTTSSSKAQIPSNPIHPLTEATHPDSSNSDSWRIIKPSIPTQPHSNPGVVGSSDHPSSAPPSHTTSSSKAQIPSNPVAANKGKSVNRPGLSSSDPSTNTPHSNSAQTLNPVAADPSSNTKGKATNPSTKRKHNSNDPESSNQDTSSSTRKRQKQNVNQLEGPSNNPSEEPLRHPASEKKYGTKYENQVAKPKSTTTGGRISIRNMCLGDWCAAKELEGGPEPLLGDFNEYWKNLPKEDIAGGITRGKNYYERQKAEAKVGNLMKDFAIEMKQAPQAGPSRSRIPKKELMVATDTRTGRNLFAHYHLANNGDISRKDFAELYNNLGTETRNEFDMKAIAQEKLDIADREAGRVRLPYPFVLGVDPRLKAEPSVSLPESLK